MHSDQSQELKNKDTNKKCGKLYQKWTVDDMTLLKEYVRKNGSDWKKIQKEIFPTRTVEQIAAKYFILKHDLMKKHKGFMKQTAQKPKTEPVAGQTIDDVVAILKGLLM
uniref:Myb-like DNA-binding domain-containing protein n=1 Tax=Trepomonas sp. PC1 TaxID=1076344 RepID=A0A146KE55_9EUKA|eukprot:JAP95110.1 Myb-like DNA-binding domain-containing protein [Trepomonas sp. PC1]